MYFVRLLSGTFLDSLLCINPGMKIGDVPSSIMLSRTAAAIEAQVIITPAIRNDVTTPIPAMSASESGQVQLFEVEL